MGHQSPHNGPWSTPCQTRSERHFFVRRSTIEESVETPSYVVHLQLVTSISSSWTVQPSECTSKMNWCSVFKFYCILIYEAIILSAKRTRQIWFQPGAIGFSLLLGAQPRKCKTTYQPITICHHGLPYTSTAYCTTSAGTAHWNELQWWMSYRFQASVGFFILKCIETFLKTMKVL